MPEIANQRAQVTRRKIAMLHAGVRPVDIAKRCRVSRAFVSALIAGRKRSARVEAIFSKLTKTPRSELWN